MEGSAVRWTHYPGNIWCVETKLQRLMPPTRLPTGRIGPDGNRVFRMRVRIGITCARTRARTECSHGALRGYCADIRARLWCVYSGWDGETKWYASDVIKEGMGEEKRERVWIICGCKKRLIAMAGCGGGQCNAVNAHRGMREDVKDRCKRFRECEWLCE